MYHKNMSFLQCEYEDVLLRGRVGETVTACIAQIRLLSSVCVCVRCLVKVQLALPHVSHECGFFSASKRTSWIRCTIHATGQQHSQLCHCLPLNHRVCLWRRRWHCVRSLSIGYINTSAPWLTRALLPSTWICRCCCYQSPVWGINWDQGG